MARYVIRRLVQMLITLWVIVSLTFVLMHALPGDPFTSPKLPEQIRQNMRIKYGLDKPLYVQYGIYLSNLAHGNLGYSLKYQQRTVNDMIRDGFPYSADLGLRAIAFGVIAGLTLGTLAAFGHDKAIDRSAMVIAVFGISVPGFIVATLLDYFLSARLSLATGAWSFLNAFALPAAGWGSFKQSLMPSFSLGLGVLATMARMMRASVLDVVGQDYIRTARAKGLNSREIIWRHTMRNAILPIVTILGPMIINIITGSVVIETIFSIPGLGRYFVQSIYNNDYTLIMGTTIFYAALLLAALFVVDMLYGVVDPRIRLAGGKE